MNAYARSEDKCYSDPDPEGGGCEGEDLGRNDAAQADLGSTSVEASENNREDPGRHGSLDDRDTGDPFGKGEEGHNHEKDYREDRKADDATSNHGGAAGVGAGLSRVEFGVNDRSGQEKPEGDREDPDLFGEPEKGIGYPVIESADGKGDRKDDGNEGWIEGLSIPVPIPASGQRENADGPDCEIDPGIEEKKSREGVGSVEGGDERDGEVAEIEDPNRKGEGASTDGFTDAKGFGKKHCNGKADRDENIPKDWGEKEVDGVFTETLVSDRRGEDKGGIKDGDEGFDEPVVVGSTKPSAGPKDEPEDSVQENRKKRIEDGWQHGNEE